MPSIVPGRSALPALAQVETDVRARFATLMNSLETARKEAHAQAEALRKEGEDRLGLLVLDAQRQAIRAVESAARDRISTARIQVQHWIDEAEEAAQEALQEALHLCSQG